ncbi:MAG TPA: hypothetical protein GXX51_12585 [Firmicutes bacterium]|nr:hypothetical protein [Bacillota bacterium]
MGRNIKITAGQVEVQAVLDDSKTADAIWDALPINGRANRWGDEIYFSIPVKLAPDNAKAVVEDGDIAYWPPGHAFCIFFGPTPASTGNEIRPASPVNVFGKITGDTAVLKRVKDGEKVTITAV